MSVARTLKIHKKKKELLIKMNFAPKKKKLLKKTYCMQHIL